MSVSLRFRVFGAIDLGIKGPGVCLTKCGFGVSCQSALTEPRMTRYLLFAARRCLKLRDLPSAAFCQETGG